MTEPRPFRRPNALERTLNRAIGALAGLGLGPAHIWVLEVRGRTSGRIRATPIDLLSDRGRLYLVAPRGYTQWVRNAEASAEITLRRGRQRAAYRLRALTAEEKPAVLKTYLDRFHREVQRYFPVAAGSPPDAFVPLASQYPAFELLSRA